MFLDVIAPKKSFESKQKHLAPVIVWVYGGGYTSGEKSSYDALGLMKRSRTSGEEVVFVAINYRVSFLP